MTALTPAEVEALRAENERLRADIERLSKFSGHPPAGTVSGSVEEWRWHAENERRSARVAWLVFHERLSQLQSLNRAAGRKSKAIQALRAQLNEYREAVREFVSADEWASADEHESGVEFNIACDERRTKLARLRALAERDRTTETPA